MYVGNYLFTYYRNQGRNGKKIQIHFIALLHDVTTTKLYYYSWICKKKKKLNLYLQLRKWETCLCPTYFCDPPSPLWIKSTNFQPLQIQYKWNTWSMSLSKMEPFEESKQKFTFVKTVCLLLLSLFIFLFPNSMEK